MPRKITRRCQATGAAVCHCKDNKGWCAKGKMVPLSKQIRAKKRDERMAAILQQLLQELQK